jgi:hypothetical protein
VFGPLDDFAVDVTPALAPEPVASRCAASKLRKTRRAVIRVMACHARAHRHAEPVATTCVSNARGKLALAFELIEQRGGCSTAGDANDVATALEIAVPIAVYAVVNGSLPGDAPDGLDASVDGAVVHLTWINPASESGHTHVKILRRLNTLPAGPDDAAADVVFFGTGTEANDDLTALLPDTATTPRTYRYVAFGCTSGGECESVGSNASLTLTVSDALRAGGYVLHWRHAAADVCADRLDLGPAATTSVPDWWKSCDAQCPPSGNATARQMNATGVTQSTSIGNAFDSRGFPIGRVVSSEFCRNFTTAALMDFGPVVEQSPLITYFVHDEPARCSDSYAFLSEVPAPGTNTALIGHAGFSCPVLESLAWGEAAVFKPDGAGSTQLITRVAWDGWQTLP